MKVALLGSTGATGTIILEYGLQCGHTIHALARDPSKLVHHPNLTIFKGSVSDQDIINQLVKGTDIVLIALGSRANVPGITVVQDGTRAAVAAMESNGCSPSRLILMTSASCNPKFVAQRGLLANCMVNFMLNYIFEDLKAAQSFLEKSQQQRPWLQWTIFQPPRILASPHEVGYMASSDETILHGLHCVSYRDCARLMLRLAEGIEERGTAHIISDVGPEGITALSQEAVASFPHGKPTQEFNGKNILIDCTVPIQYKHHTRDIARLLKQNFNTKIAPKIPFVILVGAIVGPGIPHFQYQILSYYPTSIIDFPSLFCKNSFLMKSLHAITTLPANPRTLVTSIPSGRLLSIPILYHDKDYLIINKPFDLTLQSVEKEKVTVHTILNQEFPQYSPLRHVHQLDHATSGILCFGITKKSTARLSKQFEKRKVEKTYLAIVKGYVQKKEFQVNESIGFHPEKPLHMCIGGIKSRQATTHFRCLGWGTYTEPDNASICIACSLLEVTPVSGRRHQIRVHLQHVGHPIVGDYMYEQPDFSPSSRMLLHAWKLSVPELCLQIETDNPFKNLFSLTT